MRREIDVTEAESTLQSDQSASNSLFNNTSQIPSIETIYVKKINDVNVSPVTLANNDIDLGIEAGMEKNFGNPPCVPELPSIETIYRKRIPNNGDQNEIDIAKEGKKHSTNIDFGVETGMNENSRNAAHVSEEPSIEAVYKKKVPNNGDQQHEIVSPNRRRFRFSF